MSCYFANISQRGTMKYRDVPGSLGVLESADNFMPVGQADCRGPDEDGFAVFRLLVRGRPIDGLWHIVDGEFRRVG